MSDDIPVVPVTRRPDGSWLLLAPHTALVHVPPAGMLQIDIPEGFAYDLASIPRILWRLVAPYELGLEAPLVHDWLYRGGKLQRSGVGKEWAWRPMRELADRIFRALIRREDRARLASRRLAVAQLVSPFGLLARWRYWRARWRYECLRRWLPIRRAGAYYAVRLFGVGSWRK